MTVSLIRRGNGCSLAFAIAKLLDIDCHVDRQALAARPTVVGSRGNVGVVVSAMREQHALNPFSTIGRQGTGRLYHSLTLATPGRRMPLRSAQCLGIRAASSTVQQCAASDQMQLGVLDRVLEHAEARYLQAYRVPRLKDDRWLTREAHASRCPSG